MSVLFIGKRFYTNRDALREHYGRIYQLPWHWAQSGIAARLWLVDYHSREMVSKRSGSFELVSSPVRGIDVFRRYALEMRGCGVGDSKLEVVIASGDCYIGLMGYRIARKIGARFVFDVYDKYDEFGAYRRLPGFDPLGFLLRRADVRLFASRALIEQIGSDARRDFLVPNGVDTQRFRQMDMLASRQALGLPEDINLVGYFGGMELDRGVDDLIVAVQKLRAEGMGIELLLGGKPRVDMNVSQPGIRFFGNVPYEHMPGMLASCDLLAIPYRRSAFMDAGASNKIAEAIACGRPIVATRTPNLLANFPAQAAQLGGLLATPGSSDDLARAIREQCTRRKLVDMPQGFEWTAIADRLADSLNLKQYASDQLGSVNG